MKAQNEITRGYEIVTPERAEEWLGTSIGNRPINARKVALFAQYMNDGAWNRDAQPIYFDEAGHLLDGHTRLNAVIKSGATIEVEVKRNFPRADWGKLNCATGWTAGDFGAANGVKSANSAMAAVKIREALKRGYRIGVIGGNGKGKVSGHVWTPDDLLEIYRTDEDWPEDIDIATSWWRQWHGISISMCAGVLHHLVHDCRWGRDFVCEFFRQLYSLEGITVNTRILRKRIDMDRQDGKVLTPNYVCLLVSKAFEGYATNVPKVRLQVNDIRAVAKFPTRRRQAAEALGL